ncbi:hypothetical protein M878_18235 [Streptomyces roseochromogenus subsp. oscitans DS 12.976]|uniref:Uncharacterized protein n=1 Tax=Streptomyces roseochromogenus subsp. oscitans DS 12.976 TaxID=1352936 RepID=V6KF14_STRRC|nr:hypothetical protein M878_18235 [Streptomyces roseochromogenus subsp. oscitans DS 12.976]
MTEDTRGGGPGGVADAQHGVVLAGQALQRARLPGLAPYQSDGWVQRLGQ